MSTKISVKQWEEIEDEIRNISTDQLVLLIDQNLWQHYSASFKNLLKIDGKQILLWKAPDGEKVKNIKDYETCLEFLIERGIHRNSHLIAIGGGALSDFAGFVAATVLRGISWSVVPTSLLSMIDASIGGKVAINSSLGKNLIGAFHLPQNVWINLSFLNTLDKVELCSGLGELIKYCFLDEEIFQLVLSEGASPNVIEKCARFKNVITEEDFKEGGRRKILNLGHTFGHAIEKIYHIPHGEAVVWGTYLIFKTFGSNEQIDQLKTLINALELDLNEPPWYQKSFPLMEIMDFVTRDKKKMTNSSVDLVLVQEIGKPVIEKVEFQLIQEKFKENLDEIRNFSIKS